MHTTPTPNTPEFPTTHEAAPPRSATRPRRRFGAVAGAGLLAGLIAAGLGGVASAQATGTTVIPDGASSVTTAMVVSDDDGASVGAVAAFDDSAGDEAWEAFDACLVEAGVDLESLENGDVQMFEIDEDQLDAAFESCEPILDELSDDAIVMLDDFDMELSAEDEAVFDRFDQCLVDAGVDFEALDAAEESGVFDTVDEDALDAAFESCEPILDELSDDAMFIVDLEHCDEDDEDDE